MSLLVLLNGAPGSGKSTIAQRWLEADTEHRGLVEVDLIKHALPTWPDDARSAGLRARELAADEVAALLGRNRDVVVPQFLARPDFADALAAVARRCAAEYVEVLLTLPAATVARRLEVRRTAPHRPEHVENDLGVSPDQAADLVAALDAWAADRRVRRVDATGSPEDVVARLERVLIDPGGAPHSAVAAQR